MEFDLDCKAPSIRAAQRLHRTLSAWRDLQGAAATSMAIAHSHSPSTIAFGLSNVPMRAMYHNAAFLAAGVPVFDIRDKFGMTDIVISSAA